MLLSVTHETRYLYNPPVEQAQHIAHLRPRDGGSQHLLQHALTIDPGTASRHESTDVFGNHRTFFSLQSPHSQLTVRAHSVVRTGPAAGAPVLDTPWEDVREMFRFHARLHYDAATEFVFDSPYVTRDPAFAAYAAPSFLPGRGLLAAALDLNARMFSEFRYDSTATDVGTPALLALQARQGVCQDFAHIMLACLRSMGLPARYVSGYLLTNPPPGQPRLVGADASHAWVSVYLPAAGWIDLDPTNGRMAGEDYVCLGLGRDYFDVSPVRGVIHGGANHQLSVAVTVEPVPEGTAS